MRKKKTKPVPDYSTPRTINDGVRDKILKYFEPSPKVASIAIVSNGRGIDLKPRGQGAIDAFERDVGMAEAELLGDVWYER